MVFPPSRGGGGGSGFTTEVLLVIKIGVNYFYVLITRREYLLFALPLYHGI